MPKEKKQKKPAVDMETFGPVAVDYFTGRRVEKVEEDDNGWTICFEGGGTVHNYDPSIPAPKTITGAALTMTILGAHKGKDDRTPLTELRFGLETVKLNPLEYSMTDDVHTGGQEVYAQRSHANMPVTTPHPDERVADGPSQEWIDRQEEKDEDSTEEEDDADTGDAE
jgi:hypothetical protein